jgi:hypothetical protein
MVSGPETKDDSNVLGKSGSRIEETRPMPGRDLAPCGVLLSPVLTGDTAEMVILSSSFGFFKSFGWVAFTSRELTIGTSSNCQTKRVASGWSCRNCTMVSSGARKRLRTA